MSESISEAVGQLNQLSGSGIGFSTPSSSNKILSTTVISTRWASRSEFDPSAPTSQFPIKSFVRTDTTEAPRGWSNKRADIQRIRQPGCNTQLAPYGFPGIEFHLVALFVDEPVFLLSFNYRYFFWYQKQGLLRYVVTPYTMFGIYRALDRGESLQYEDVRPVVSHKPKKKDVISCAAVNKPDGWNDDPVKLLQIHNSFNTTLWNIVHRQPVLSYLGRNECDDMEFFRSENRHYLYKSMNHSLYLIFEPDMSEPANWKRLSEAPRLGSFRLAEVHVDDISGGKRTIRDHDIPAGWSRQEVAVDPAPYMQHHNDGPLKPVSIIVRKCRNGEMLHLVEHNDLYFFWFENRPEPIPIPSKAGLPDILSLMRDFSAAGPQVWP